MDTGSTQFCCSDRREPRREWGFCSDSEDDDGGCPFPFESSFILSFDRATPVRPFDVLGLLFERLGIDGSTDSGDSTAAVVAVVVSVVEGVAADETGRDVAEARKVALGSREGIGRVLSAGSSSMRSFSLRARVSRAMDSGIGRGTTSMHHVFKKISGMKAEEVVVPSRNLRGEI